MSSVVSEELQRDVRLIERGRAKGFLSQAVANELLGDLPDVGDKADWIDIESEEEAEPAAAAPKKTSEAPSDGG